MVHGLQPRYMREIATIWQIGVPTQKPCTFGPHWVIFGTLAPYKWGEGFEGFGRKMTHSFYLSWCLQKVSFYLTFYRINRPSDWLWLETQVALQDVNGFQNAKLPQMAHLFHAYTQCDKRTRNCRAHTHSPTTTETTPTQTSPTQKKDWIVIRLDDELIRDSPIPRVWVLWILWARSSAQV